MALAFAIACDCGGSAPPQPTPTSPALGAWSGRISDQALGDGTFHLVLAVDQPSSSYRGTWSATFPSASISGSAVSALLNPLPLVLACQSGGSAASTVTVDGSRMSGTYFTLDCQRIARGSLDLTKQ